MQFTLSATIMSIIGQYYLKSTTCHPVDQLGLGYVHINLVMFSISGLASVSNCQSNNTHTVNYFILSATIMASSVENDFMQTLLRHDEDNGSVNNTLYNRQNPKLNRTTETAENF